MWQTKLPKKRLLSSDHQIFHSKTTEKFSIFQRKPDFPHLKQGGKKFFFFAQNRMEWESLSTGQERTTKHVLIFKVTICNYAMRCLLYVFMCVI